MQADTRDMLIPMITLGETAITLLGLAPLINRRLCLLL